MSYRLRLAGAALLLAAALSACAKQDDTGLSRRSPTAAATRQPTAVAEFRSTPQPSGTAAAVTPAPPPAKPGDDVRGTARFTIRLPEGWRALPLSKEQIEAVAKDLGPSNPQSATLKGLIDANQWNRLEFFAFDPASTDYVTVLKAPLGQGATSQSVFEQVKVAVPQTIQGTFVRGGRAGLTIDGKDAAVLQVETSTLGAGGASGQRLYSAQYYVLHGAEATVISVSGAPRDGFDQLAERIATTFHLK